MNRREQVEAMVRAGQDRLVRAFEAADGARFREETWSRPGGGGGRARLLAEGAVFERAGVNVSAVWGSDLPDGIARARALPSNEPFFATGISMVLHPTNPHVPAFHANLRYFEVGDGADWWFGGGADLTPAYPREEDARHFHRTLSDWCATHEVADYPAFKAWCDRYFYLPHRGEMRGIGGVFFDHLKPDGEDGWDAAFAFVSDGIRAIEDAYLPLVAARRDDPWTDREREWQLLRRGRYVEFNLLYDRGTRFGLQTDGNVEAILMSLPPRVRWERTRAHPPDSPEGRTAAFLQPRDWLID